MIFEGGRPVNRRPYSSSLDYVIVLNTGNEKIDDDRFSVYINREFSNTSNKGKIITLSESDVSTLLSKGNVQIEIVDNEQLFEQSSVIFSKWTHKYSVKLEMTEQPEKLLDKISETISDKISNIKMPIIIACAFVLFVIAGVLFWNNYSDSITDLFKPSPKKTDTLDSVKVTPPSQSPQPKVSISAIQAAWNKLDSMSCCMDDVLALEELLKKNPDFNKDEVLKNDEERKDSFNKEMIERRIDLYKDFFTRALYDGYNAEKGLGIDFVNTLYRYPDRYYAETFPEYFSDEQKEFFRHMCMLRSDSYWAYRKNQNKGNKYSFEDIRACYDF